MAMRIITALLLSAFIGQTLKIFLGWNQYHRINLWVYFEDGGMPSLHGSVLAGLTTALFYETSVSPIFLVSAVFSIVILGDIMKFRSRQGIQSELMARFIDFREILRRKLTESTGHTPEQVFVGVILGFLVASLVYLL